MDDGAAELRRALERVIAEGQRDAGPLAGRVDASSVAAVGHSMGGNAALTVASDEGVAAWVTLASGEFALAAAPDRSALVMVGEHDGIAIADDVRDGYDEMSVGDKRFLSLARAGHLAFTDICAIGRARGGILAITSPYTWLEEHTPKENWLGGFYHGDQAVRTYASLQQILSPQFEEIEALNLPFLIREHARKNQYSIAHATLWRKR